MRVLLMTPLREVKVQVALEMDVHHGAHDLSDSTDAVCRHLWCSQSPCGG